MTKRPPMKCARLFSRGAQSTMESFCLACGYRLTGLASLSCPECGRPFSYNDPHTYDQSPHTRLVRAARVYARRLTVVLLSVVVLAGASATWLYHDWKVENDFVLVAQQFRRNSHGSRSEIVASSIEPKWLRRPLGPRWEHYFDRADQAYFTGPDVNDDVIARLQTLRGLECITIDNARVTDSGLIKLGKFKRLRAFQIRFFGPRGELGKVSDDALEFLDGCATLEELRLTNCSVDGRFLIHARSWVRLKVLDLSYSPITDPWLRHLAGLATLCELYLANSRVTGSGLADLPRLKSLQILDLAGSPLNHAAFPAIGFASKTLTYLNIDHTGATDEDLAQLRGLTGLQSLSLDADPVGAEGMKYVAAMRGLEWLSLRDTRLDDAGLSYLSSLSRLESLDLEGTAVTDVGLHEIAGMHRMVKLSIGGRHVTDRGMTELRALKSLSEVHLHRTSVTDGGIASLRDALPGLAVYNETD